ncbi:hypothetical protein ABZY16_29125 [Streptomyces sp. NPDC006553]|uniref:hypothetical protein n=1 Tax=Streptomyces sp. NPDC006553 TaxID=3157180 RepID=UPI0033A895B3
MWIVTGPVPSVVTSTVPEAVVDPVWRRLVTETAVTATGAGVGVVVVGVTVGVVGDVGVGEVGDAEPDVGVGGVVTVGVVVSSVGGPSDTLGPVLPDEEGAGVVAEGESSGPGDDGDADGGAVSGPGGDVPGPVLVVAKASAALSPFVSSTPARAARASRSSRSRSRSPGGHGRQR